MHPAPPSRLSLDTWTTQAIDRECGPSYHRYEKARRQQYVEYFARHPELRCSQQTHSAKTVAAALPPGWGELQALIPRNASHVHARSAKSSQTLALALLGCAACLEPSFRWFWRALNLPVPKSTLQHPSFAFERRLSPSDLNEKPHATVLDFAVDDPGFFVAVEAKWTERGLGVCSCDDHGTGSPDAGGHCANRVLDRTRYWKAATEFFGICAERLPLFGCPLSPIYQAVRNVAAAQRLAGDKRPFGFILLYDAENPYFCPTGTWLGWPAILRAHLCGHEDKGLHFRALSWQELIPALPLDGQVCQWAKEKHRLG